MQHNQLPTKKILYGSVAALVTFAALYNTSGIGSAVLLCTIQASAAKPVLLEASAEVITAFNAGTTNVLTLGTNTTATQILGAADITEGTPGFYPAGAGVGKVRLVANTDIYVKYAQTGTAASTGAAKIYLRMTPLNLDEQPQLTA